MSSDQSTVAVEIAVASVQPSFCNGPPPNPSAVAGRKLVSGHDQRMHQGGLEVGAENPLREVRVGREGVGVSSEQTNVTWIAHFICI